MSKRAFAGVCFGMLVAGCHASVPSILPAPPAGPSSIVDGTIRTPAVVVVTPNGILKYYPVTPNGGRSPITITKVSAVHFASAMAANGRELVIADSGKPSIVLYNLTTKTTRVLADKFGVPIDVAVDRSGNLYALNQGGSSSSTVVMYRARTRQAEELTCKDLASGAAIATDDEGDVFVNGYGTSTPGVFEIPNGPSGPQSQHCKQLPLQPEQGYAAGIAVDPKTDDLIVVSNPGSCSGGIEGQMTIYPKPYDKRSGRSADLNGRCAGPVRLNAASSLIFALDRTSAFAHPYVIQRSYPQGSGDASYRHRYIGGFTTLPNALPN
jgi:hypothetical protein